MIIDPRCHAGRGVRLTAQWSANALPSCPIFPQTSIA